MSYYKNYNIQININMNVKNTIRTMVSGTRRRMTDGNYNIDLTYICQDRIIVMSYPAVNTKQQFYRNDANTVSIFI